ncbi:MAG: VanZ family protein, partial [bacterium]|nr:VanZ family protein [bacterium]
NFFKIKFILKKLAHFAEYAVLAALWLRVLTAANIPKRRAILFAVFFCFIFAVFDEIHQLYVPGREGKTGDVLIDSLGVLLGAAIFSTKN